MLSLANETQLDTSDILLVKLVQKLSQRGQQWLSFLTCAGCSRFIGWQDPSGSDYLLQEHVIR